MIAKMAAMTQMILGAPLGARTAVPSFSTSRPRLSVARAASREYGVWLPDTEPPAHLTGELPGGTLSESVELGLWWAVLQQYTDCTPQNVLSLSHCAWQDFGFDPLGLGSDPDRLKWYAEAEKTNGR